jgi:hypothetical protein
VNDDVRKLGPRALDGARLAKRAALALSLREQLELLAWLVDYLEAGTGRKTDVPAGVLAEARALAWLDQVAKRLELAAGEPPTREAYERVYKLVPGAMSATTVGRIFGSWQLATDAFRRGGRPETAAQASMRRDALGRGRAFEDYISGGSLWLESNPHSRERKDYNGFVREWNPTRPADALPLVLADTATRQTGLSWVDFVACAGGELTREQALERRREPKRGPVDCGPLVGIGAVAALLGYGSTWLPPLRDARFPRPVALLGAERKRVWRRTDIEAYRDGSSDALSTAYELQDEILLAADICTRLAIAKSSLRTYLCHHPDRAPAPAGRAAGTYWWRRTDVEAWLAEHPLPTRQRIVEPGSHEAHRRAVR